MVTQYQWLEVRTPRSVENLRLWAENPRLDPDDIYSTIKDFATEMTATKADKDNFIDLAKSIALNGFIPGDPVVVWQNSLNNKYYVAEGNRRVLALKLLRDPQKAPRDIKGAFLRLSNDTLIKSIEKIPVCVAPHFDDAEWYISQRNSTSSLQRPWSREQQLRWIVRLYDKYKGDINIIKEKSGLSESEILVFIRAVKLRDIIKDVKDRLPEDIYSQAISLQFPISTLERFLTFSEVRKAWGIEFDGAEVSLTKDPESFLNAYAELIKRMYLPNSHDNYIDSRKINQSTSIGEILKSFPIVSDKTTEKIVEQEPDSNEKKEDDNKSNDLSILNKIKIKPLKNHPYRDRLVQPYYTLNTSNFRLKSLFNELKNIPIKRYQNTVAASIRVFLDLAVFEYIGTENFKPEICKEYTDSLENIILKKRLEFIKKKVKKKESSNIIGKLINPDNEYSLDVLNGYVHGPKTHYLTYTFLNGFWDFLFPLFEEFLEIIEKD
jgi:hypothetical protein